ncbi:hypothetical protein F2Q70_00032847 [Brassica cretica]|uniref:3-beta hydroxysteroid dehydrogenase/isomerase domain-containing protein n=1 Tax=Brassica cretica TaxID=69181 RepID=A0A8S9FQX7_BRACR|nr:hypothetical protein F2Q70_00032847 [Brassica cretica]
MGCSQMLQFTYANLGDAKALLIQKIPFSFCRYYHNITSNTLVVLEAVADFKVKKLIYTSTCPTNEEPDKMRITEVTPQILQSPHKPSLSHDHVSSDLSVIDS